MIEFKLEEKEPTQSPVVIKTRIGKQSGNLEIWAHINGDRIGDFIAWIEARTGKIWIVTQHQGDADRLKEVGFSMSPQNAITVANKGCC